MKAFFSRNEECSLNFCVEAESPTEQVVLEDHAAKFGLVRDGKGSKYWFIKEGQ